MKIKKLIVPKGRFAKTPEAELLLEIMVLCLAMDRHGQTQTLKGQNDELHSPTILSDALGTRDGTLQSDSRQCTVLSSPLNLCVVSITGLFLLIIVANGYCLCDACSTVGIKVR